MPANRPTELELLNAVQEFLRTEVLPLLDGDQKYHLQVSLSALAIVGREIASSAQLDDAEHGRLASLLGVEDTRDRLNTLLARRIRERQLSYRDASLMQHLMRTAMGKMSIDNPKYATYQRALASS
jgi:hypothetical protein